MERILFTLPLTELSIERSLNSYLIQSIPAQFNLKNITFYSIQAQDSIIYQCSVLIQLAKGDRTEAQQIAHQMMADFKTTNTQFSLEVETMINHSGLLEFILKEQIINQWLSIFIQVFKLNYKVSILKHYELDIDQKYSTLQYAHARCCSLLRAGHFDNIIQLKTLDFTQFSWLSPEPIPFTQIWQQVEEKELIYQIIKVIDGQNSEKPRKLAEDLSKAFFKFERSCRIWGEVKRDNLTLAQARLGLIALVQLLLRFLLTEKLGVMPLTEL